MAQIKSLGIVFFWKLRKVNPMYRNTLKKPVMLCGIDLSYGFTSPGLPMYVPGAETLPPLIHRFLDRVPFGHFHTALWVNDTHFAEEYAHNPERHTKPLHQQFGTHEHCYAVDVHRLQGTLPLWMWKNTQDMWCERALETPLCKIKFHRYHLEHYALMFYLMHIDRYNIPDFVLPRDLFFSLMQYSGPRSVVMMGCATDYGVKDAMIGFLSRGFEVVLLTDLTCGVYNNRPPERLTCLDDLIARCPVTSAHGESKETLTFWNALRDDKLKLMTSDDYLAWET